MINNLICWHNGKYIAIKHVNVSILDFGFIHSDATYDVMKTSNGNILFYDKHLTRYQESCEYFGFDAVENVDEIVKELLDINKIENAFVWVCNWRGTPPSGSPRDMSGPEHRVVYIKPYYSIADSSVSLGVFEENKRTPDASIPQKYKNFGWIELTRAQKYADSNNFDSALLVDSNNNITEGPGFGVCFVDNNIVYTPKENCLGSVTIQVVEDICKQNNIQFIRTNINNNLVNKMEECFICSTSGGITPVKSIEGIEFKSNELTKRLIDLFEKQE